MHMNKFKEMLKIEKLNHALEVKIHSNSSLFLFLSLCLCRSLSLSNCAEHTKLEI